LYYGIATYMIFTYDCIMVLRPIWFSPTIVLWYCDLYDFHLRLYYGIMVLWYYGIMVLWYYGIMVLWYYGIMVLWYYGIMVLWYYGIATYMIFTYDCIMVLRPIWFSPMLILWYCDLYNFFSVFHLW